jgi:hypothetical protein
MDTVTSCLGRVVSNRVHVRFLKHFKIPSILCPITFIE